MNAVERLWRALRREDWAAAEAQLHEHVVVRHPHSGRRYDRASAYLDFHKLDRDRGKVDVRGVVGDGKHIALLAVLGHHGGPDWHCAGFYELQDGHIAHATEIWTPDGAHQDPHGPGESELTP